MSANNEKTEERNRISIEVSGAAAIVKLSLPYITSSNPYDSDLSNQNLRNKIQILLNYIAKEINQ